MIKNRRLNPLIAGLGWLLLTAAIAVSIALMAGWKIEYYVSFVLFFIKEIPERVQQDFSQLHTSEESHVLKNILLAIQFLFLVLLLFVMFKWGKSRAR